MKFEEVLANEGGAITMALNLDKCIDQLYRCEILPEATVKQLCDKLKEVLIYESNVQNISSPVTVVAMFTGTSQKQHFIKLTFPSGNFSTCWSFSKLGGNHQIPIISSLVVRFIFLMLCSSLAIPRFRG